MADSQAIETGEVEAEVESSVASPILPKSAILLRLDMQSRVEVQAGVGELDCVAVQMVVEEEEAVKVLYAMGLTEILEEVAVYTVVAGRP